MKRDMELMRKILFEIEDKYKPGESVIFNLSITGYDNPIVGEHCDLIYQSGLINKYKAHFSDNTLSFFHVGNLTNAGYDYLELIRNEGVWEETKAEVQKKNLPQTIETIGTVAGSIVGAFMREYNR